MASLGAGAVLGKQKVLNPRILADPRVIAWKQNHSYVTMCCYFSQLTLQVGSRMSFPLQASQTNGKYSTSITVNPEFGPVVKL